MYHLIVGGADFFLFVFFIFFYFLRICFLSSITAKTFYVLDCIHEQHCGCSIRSRNSLPFESTWVHPSYCWGPCCSSFQFFCIVLSCFFSFWIPWRDVRYNFPVVCRRAHVLLILSVLVCVLLCPTPFEFVFFFV